MAHEETQAEVSPGPDVLAAETLDQVLSIVKEEEFEASELTFLLDLDDVDIGHLLESVPPELRLPVWSVVPVDRLWPVLNHLQKATAGHLVSTLAEPQLADLLTGADDADILALADYLPERFLDALLEEVDEERASEVQAALAYTEDQVGRYIDHNILRVRPRLPLSRLLARMQARAEAPPEAVFVVDRSGELQGRLDYGRLLSADPTSYVGSLVYPVHPCQESDSLEEVMRDTDVDEAGDWLPVMREGKVVGTLSPGVLLRELKRRNLETLVTEARSDEEDLFMPVRAAARIRAFWLLINLATAFLASAVIGLFEGVVREVVALAVLMPVVASMGGIAGSQTLAIALRGLALNHLSEANLNLVLAKEARIAVLNGVVLGMLIGVVVWLWFDSVALGAIIFCAILINGLAAAAAGTVVPFWLQRLRIDPAVSGSVILTTVTDVVGFFVFLGLGTVVFLGL